MAVRFLLDENIEHEVLHRLEKLGFETAHVEFHPELGKGSEDGSIVEFSRRNQWVVVTYDPDFVEDHSESDYHGAIYFEDDDMSAREISEVLRAMASNYPDSAFEGLEFGGRDWL